MKKLWGSCLLIVLLAQSPAHATFNFYSGKALNEDCTQYLRSDAGEDYDSLLSFSCMSYVAGVYDTFALMSLDPNICIPSELTLGQATTIAAVYIRDRPGVWHEEAAELVLRSLTDAFDCP